jgi:hypothetical protein
VVIAPWEICKEVGIDLGLPLVGNEVDLMGVIGCSSNHLVLRGCPNKERVPLSCFDDILFASLHFSKFSRILFLVV